MVVNGAAGGMRQAEYSLKKPSELTLAERAAWREFVAADPALGSPYFALEFAQCCEEARSRLSVDLIEYLWVFWSRLVGPCDWFLSCTACAYADYLPHFR